MEAWLEDKARRVFCPESAIPGLLQERPKDRKHSKAFGIFGVVLSEPAANGCRPADEAEFFPCCLRKGRLVVVLDGVVLSPH